MSMSYYKQQYTEGKVLGRGNFGVAMLVTEIATGKKWVAKKILLGQMPENEKVMSSNEANLLQQLNSPFIVGYKESFIEENDLLIIIMEWCELGDLAGLIKERQESKNYFSENQIVQWFIQICVALQYIHERNILHRDIKASNIYITANNIIKLGDFGISKVLQNTAAIAQTVVGTPYYMSPEVCQNIPYSTKSDVWSLGCLLYEMCTLSHAFAADNLLGLVFKIVQGNYDPIPSQYSPQLGQIVDIILNKDVNARPTIPQLMSHDNIKNFMEQFVNTQGESLKQDQAVRETPLQIKARRQHEKQIHATAPQQAAPQQPQETPKQAAERRKREAADAHGAQMAQAARGSIENYQISRERNAFEHTSGTIRSADFNITQPSNWDAPIEQSIVFPQYNNPQYNNTSPDRAITGSGVYNIPKAEESDEEYYEDDFEEYETVRQEEMSAAVNAYMGAMAKATMNRTGSGLPLDSIAETSMEQLPETPTKPSHYINPMELRLREVAINAMGPDMFERVYSYYQGAMNYAVDSATMKRELM